LGQGEEVTHDTYQVDDFVKYTTFSRKWTWSSGISL
jgi:hypothetical protein